MLMNHRTSVCDASNSTAKSGWATFKPETDAMTAIRAMQTAIRIDRRWRGSVLVESGAIGCADRIEDIGYTCLTATEVFGDKARILGTAITR